MKKDMDLVRQILLRMEEHKHGYGPRELEINGYSEEQIGYHCYLLDQAGLIEAIDMSGDDDSSPNAMPRSLTWGGHEFIQNAKNESSWLHAKASVAKVGDASISVWASVLASVMERNLVSSANKTCQGKLKAARAAKPADTFCFAALKTQNVLLLGSLCKGTMRIVFVLAAALLSSCSYLKYELDYASQRSKAKSYDDYIPWTKATPEVVSRCNDIRSISQGHSRVVGVSFEGGYSFTTITPEIDQILDVVSSCRNDYDGISIIME